MLSLNFKKRWEFLALPALMLFAVIASAGQSFGGTNDLNCDASGCTAGTALTVADRAVTAAKLGEVCTAGQVLLSSGNGVWACGTVAGSGGGTITGVTAGSGLTGGGTTGAVTLGLTSCTQNQILKSSGAGWQCSSEAVTGITAGSGIIVSGTGNITIKTGYGKVAVVAVSNGDYTDPVTAMGAIATWCGTPSFSNTCLMKIMPGVYNIGSSSLTIPPYVDVEGSGESTTTITGGVTSTISGPGLVSGNSVSELRFLTVKNVYALGVSAAIYTAPTAGPITPFKITNVSASASGGTTYNIGILNGAPAGFSLAPEMTNVTASASGGTRAYGVYNYSSSPKMTNVTASAYSASDYNIGVANITSYPTMTNVTALASGGTNDYSVYNDRSSPKMTNVTASAYSGTNDYGVYNITSGTVKIDHSAISGTTSSINNGAGVTTYVGASRLEGGAVSNAGTLTCVGAYNAAYVALTAGCL